ADVARATGHRARGPCRRGGARGQSGVRAPAPATAAGARLSASRGIGFAEGNQVSDLPDAISLREVGPRDGLQNEDPVPTDAKVALIDALSETGVRRIEAVSFVHPK